jgi:hypothetical protein
MLAERCDGLGQEADRVCQSEQQERLVEDRDNASRKEHHRERGHACKQT